MALNQTSVTIVGRLASKPDHRLTTNDVDITHFRLASNERRFDRNAEQWVNGDQLFIDVTCWRRLAFNVSSCLAKGDPVVVTGRLYTYEYEVEGKRRSSIRMEATAVGPDLSWITAAVRRRQQRAEAGAAEVDDAAEVGAAAGAGQQQPEIVDELANAVDQAAAMDELTRQLLDQPPGLVDEGGLRPTEGEEALMATV